MVVIGSAFLLYALTRLENLALAHDSLNYLSDIEAGGARLFHPHHLLYNAAAVVWLKLGRLLGLASDTAAAIALLNSVFGALAAGTLYALLRKRGHLTTTRARPKHDDRRRCVLRVLVLQWVCGSASASVALPSRYPVRRAGRHTHSQASSHNRVPTRCGHARPSNPCALRPRNTGRTVAST